MGSITAWLEKSLEKCSLEDGQCQCQCLSTSSDSSDSEMDNRCAAQHHNNRNQESSTTVLAVASSSESDHDNSLPYHWEQCLHLKTGEVYYINWSNGMKVREDPRRTTAGYNGDYDEDEEEESNVYNTSESEESSTSSKLWKLATTIGGSGNGRSRRRHEETSQDSVLVVAGCKSCLLYRMVPKHAEVCPKCSGQLLHFNPNPTSSP